MKTNLNQNVILLTIKERIENQKRNPFEICLKISKPFENYVFFMFLGNLNYLQENHLVHIKGSQNVTFNSKGNGIIDID